jgi:hypothetical protein
MILTISSNFSLGRQLHKDTNRSNHASALQIFQMACLPDSANFLLPDNIKREHIFSVIEINRRICLRFLESTYRVA